MSTLQLKSISKSFGETEVLNNIDLAIKDKEFVVFVGPSGCGKSTLLRIIAGLEVASAGEILIDNNEVSNLHPVDRGISMVFQSYALYPHLSVYENIAFPLRVQKLEKSELDNRVKKAADILQLTDRLDFKPGQLSGGQRQRVAIGRSIVRNPRIFLFDEPLSNLDAALRGDMRVELSQLHKELKSTMVYVTHDQIEAMTMADRIVVLNGGVVEQFGSPMDLYHQPQTRFVAGFIGQPNMNFISGTVSEAQADHVIVDVNNTHQLQVPVDGTDLQTGSSVEIGIRPEDVRLTSDTSGLPLHVSVVERLGGTSIIYGTFNNQTKFCASVDGYAPVVEDKTTYLDIPGAHMHLFDSNGRACQRLSIPDFNELAHAL